MEYENKTVIVTGSARGIGREIAIKFGGLGANVVVFDIDIEGQAETAQTVCDEIKAAGGGAKYYLGDVSKPDDTDGLIKFAKDEFGSVDVIVNNAGITRDNLIMRMSEADWDAVLTVNLKGAFNVIKSAGQANYAASKAGLIGLTKSVAKELASRNIRCNAIAPGFIQTPMTDKLPENIQQSYKDAIPLKRFGQVEDIANLAVFLAGDGAKYITGQVINVDGGLVM